MERGRQPRELCASMLALRSVGVESTPQGSGSARWAGTPAPPGRAAHCIRGCLPRPLASGSRRAVVVPARDGERLSRRRAAAPVAEPDAPVPRPVVPRIAHAPTRVRRQRDAAPLARQAHADLRWRRPRALRRGDGGAWRVALLLADQHQRARGLACLARPLARRLRLRRAARGARGCLCVAAPRRGRRLRRQRRARHISSIDAPMVLSGALSTAPLPRVASSARRAVRSCTSSGRGLRSCISVRRSGGSSSLDFAGNSLRLTARMPRRHRARRRVARRAHGDLHPGRATA